MRLNFIFDVFFGASRICNILNLVNLFTMYVAWQFFCYMVCFRQTTALLLCMCLPNAWYHFLVPLCYPHFIHFFLSPSFGKMLYWFFFKFVVMIKHITCQFYCFFLSSGWGYVGFFAFSRILSSKCMPSSRTIVIADRFNFTGICVFSYRSNEKFSNKLYKITFSSINAKREPVEYKRQVLYQLLSLSSRC